jgi:bis(5'-nucleosyl)-tetraphosphatase (symmetrical)
MAVYAIGDVQGCFDELQALLDRIGFTPGADRLWFAGDLVNRGPKSLETLRFIRDLGDTAVSVLGNHDLHLLAAAHGHPIDHDDHTLDAILTAPDRDELIDWLRHRPLLHHDGQLGFTMVHAGLPPQWDLGLASSCARELEAVLQSDRTADFIAHMYGNKPKRWSEDLAGWDRLRFIVNCLTRMRFCNRNGKLEFRCKGAPGKQREGYYPWFEIPWRASRDLNIVFGHWSTLGTYDAPGIYPIDTACLWGGTLTALQIDCEQPRRTELECQGHKAPG